MESEFGRRRAAMVRGLEQYLAEVGLVHQLDLSSLKDTRLGIDGAHWIDSLTDLREPFVAALGGTPLTLGARIEEQLRAFDASKIKPVVVFNGLDPAKKEGPAASYNAEELSVRPARRQQAWEQYDKGRIAQASQGFAASISTSVKDVLRLVHRQFKHRNVEFMTAPYLAAAQLIYLKRHPKPYIHAIFGSTDLLLFDNVDKVILSIDWSTSKFVYVSKNEVLAHLQLTADQFLDVCLLAGFEHCPTLPVFPPHDFNFKAPLSLVQGARTGLAVILQFGLQATPYPEQFARARALIKYSLVLATDDGHVLPLPFAVPTLDSAASTAKTVITKPAIIDLNEVPQDLHEVFSYRFPDEVYFQLWRGLFGGSVLSALASGYWVDEPPLCGGATDDYKRFLKETLTEHPQGPRCVALGLTSSALNQFWGKKPVVSRIQSITP